MGTEVDVARTLRRHQLRVERNKRDIFSKGSCTDGTCGRSCAWQHHGCKHGIQCTFCHVCPPTADAAGKRQESHYLREKRGFHKDRKGRKSMRSSDSSAHGEASVAPSKRSVESPSGTSAQSSSH